MGFIQIKCSKPVSPVARGYLPALQKNLGIKLQLVTPVAELEDSFATGQGALPCTFQTFVNNVPQRILKSGRKASVGYLPALQKNLGA
jgi:hypothetical protein